MEKPKSKPKLKSKPKKTIDKIFYLDKQEIKAGGILFYRIKNDNIDLLLIKRNNKYEDFGGKVDEEDNNIEETIAREVEEESNKIFKKENIINILKDNIENYYYNKTSKYLLYLVKLNSDFDTNVDKFGNMENHDKIFRRVEYVKLETFLDKEFQNNICFRLKIYSLLNKLRQLLVQNNSNL